MCNNVKHHSFGCGDIMGHYGTLGDVGRARETLAIGGFWHECDTIATQCDVV